jgi:malonyl-CoA/methylmalonyl-CoA synthetase
VEDERRPRFLGERELVNHVAALLAPHKRPRDVVFIEELPSNEMGKVQKTLLKRGGSSTP